MTDFKDNSKNTEFIIKTVYEALKEKGYRLKIWDAFRTVEAQFVLWEVYPVDEFVADPNKGGSSHNCGNTVDVTVIDENGNEKIGLYGTVSNKILSAKIKFR